MQVQFPAWWEHRREHNFIIPRPCNIPPGPGDGIPNSHASMGFSSHGGEGRLSWGQGWLQSTPRWFGTIHFETSFFYCPKRKISQQSRSSRILPALFHHHVYRTVFLPPKLKTIFIPTLLFHKTHTAPQGFWPKVSLQNIQVHTFHCYDKG